LPKICIIAALVFYFWSEIEPFVLMLPIEDPKALIESLKSFVGSTVSGGSTTQDRSEERPSGYSGNLESAPDAYLQGDDDEDSSDEEIAKGSGDKPKLDYDSDEKNDDEAMPMSSEPGSSELIDLGGSSGNDASTGQKKSIPKLAGPGK